MTVDGIRIGRKAEYDLYEMQAHRFAAAFLLPQEGFANEFYSATLEALQAIKAKWKVSIAMMIVRAQNLGFISDETAKKLWINYSRRRWRGNEPLDDKLVPEQPRLLRRSFELLLEKRIIAKEHITIHLPISPVDIENLAGLDSGFISQRVHDLDPPIRVLNLGAAQDKSLKRHSGGGQVVEFPTKQR